MRLSMAPGNNQTLAPFLAYIGYVKIVASIFLNVILLWPVLVNSAIIVDFKLNQSWIVSEQCEQRQAINNTCNGICVLDEKLSTEKPSQDQDLQPRLFSSELSYLPLSNYIQWVVHLEANGKFNRSTRDPSSGIAYSCWKPPRMVTFIA